MRSRAAGGSPAHWRRAPARAPARARTRRARSTAAARRESAPGSAARRARRGGRRRAARRAGSSICSGNCSEVASQRVAADHVRQQQRRVGHVARQRAGLIQRGGEGDHPVARDRAVGRLEPDDPAQRRRLADRAAGVGAQRPRRQSGGDGRRAAARRAAGHAPAVPRVERRPEGRVLVRGAHRELVLVGLRQQRRPGRVQTLRRPSPCTAGGSPRGFASPTGWARPWCRTGP